MGERERYEPGTPAWVDVASPDPQAAAAFYGGLFGWEADFSMGEASGGYGSLLRGGRQVAGIGPTMGGPPAWTTYVKVGRADETVAQVTEAGGTVLAGPMDLPNDAGRMAACADPEGAVISVIQQGRHQGAQVVNGPGAWGWSELNTRDVERATAFYTDVFGWTTKGDPAQYVEWQVGGRTVGGMMPMAPGVPADVPAHWLVYIGTDDTDATVATATELGGGVVAPAMDVEPGRIAVLSDPFGALFAVLQAHHWDD